MQHSCRKSACQAIDDKLKLIKKTCVEFEGRGAARRPRDGAASGALRGERVWRVRAVWEGERRRGPSAGAWKPPRNSLEASSRVPCNASLAE